MYAIPTPGQVTGVTAAEAGQHSADVSWTAPASGGPVTSYKITPYIGSTAQTATTITGTPPATSKTVTGLTTGTTYTFTVQALNANGAGPGVGAVERGDAVGARGALGADRRDRAARRRRRRS